MPQRISWIDCWKGMAIIALVAGHIFSSNIAKYIFWFHIPLFFFISGYLYKEKYDYLSFFKNKLLYLIVPYISFLIVFSIPSCISYLREFCLTKQFSSLYELLIFTLKQLYGGQILTGHFGVFWLVTCLFFTQQIYNFLSTQFGSYKWLISIIMLDMYCLAMIDYWFFQDIIFPWNIDVVLMAIPYYWLGHMASKKPHILNSQRLLIAAITILALVFIIDNSLLLNIKFDMKLRSYGIPMINLLIAMAGILVVKQIAQILDKLKVFDSFNREIGAASMAIMYLHQPIQLSLQRINILDTGIIRLIIALIIPYLIYRLMINFSFTRKFFLGEFKTTSKEKFKKLSKV